MSMNNNSNQQNLCKQGCGFYGSAQNMDMCSKCYQVHLRSATLDDNPRPSQSFTGINDIFLQSQENQAEPIVIPPSKGRKRSTHSDTEVVCKVSKSSYDESDVHASVNSQHSNTTITKKPRRCLFCHRKVGLTGFDCRCGGHFCSVHRYSDKHSCSFDYQAQGQEQIKNQNPMICGSKIKKI